MAFNFQWQGIFTLTSVKYKFMSDCLCTLPPQRTPYTCLCLYAISNVPDCNSCSAPCTSYEPDCCERDEYLRVLHVLDVALGSCLPLVCCSLLYTELNALQSASTPSTCETALGNESVACTGATYDEHTIEQQTTLVFYLAQHAQQQVLPVYNHTSLIPLTLHQSTLHWVCTSLTNDTTSLVRTVYLTYQRVNAILKYNKIATDINRMDKNALQYKMNRLEGNKAWKEQTLQHAKASNNFTAIRSAQLDVDELDTKTTALQATLQATEKHYANLQTVKQSYVEIQKTLEFVLKNTCKLFSDHWLNVGCNGDTNTQTVRSIVLHYSGVAMHLQQVRSRLENVDTFVQQSTLERNWSGSGHITFKTSPALDAHLVKLGNLHLEVESNRQMREHLTSFLSSFFCEDGSVNGTYRESAWCNPQLCMLKMHMGELRHRVALAEAVVHGVCM